MYGEPLRLLRDSELREFSALRKEAELDRDLVPPSSSKFFGLDGGLPPAPLFFSPSGLEAGLERDRDRDRDREPEPDRDREREGRVVSSSGASG